MHTFLGKEDDFGSTAFQVNFDLSLEIETDLIYSLWTIGEVEVIILIIVILPFDNVERESWIAIRIEG
jgi:hypothetical protein